jgi:hypothetical protein
MDTFNNKKINKYKYDTMQQFTDLVYTLIVRNGYGAKFIWYEMVSGYGTKLKFCGTKW